VTRQAAVLQLSQSFKPRQNGCVRSPQRRSIVFRMVDRLGLFDGFPLHLEIGGGITVDCGDTGVAKPLADRNDADSRSQQMYRSGMAHAVAVETFVRECRSHRMSSRTMFPENVADAEPGEAGAMTIAEERIVGRRRATTLGEHARGVCGLQRRHGSRVLYARA
jgi:hypothetical protein